MSERFDAELLALRGSFTAQMSSCFEALERAREVLATRDTALAARVVASDRAVDRQELAIEAECVRLLSLRHPVARDLRLIVSLIKLNGELERIADHAGNICRLAATVVERGGELPPALQDLAERVVRASREVFLALSHEDLPRARAVLAGDAAVDRLDRSVRRAVHELLENQQDVESALAVHRISRELERAGDLLGNMAEDIIWLATGETVRHSGAA